MKFLVAVILALTVLAGCGGLDGGTVVSKDHREGYYHTVIVPIYTGEDCEQGYDGQEECTSRYIYMPQQRWEPPEWWLIIEGNCRQEDGQHKCDRATKYVSEDTYSKVQVGVWFGPTPVATGLVATPPVYGGH